MDETRAATSTPPQDDGARAFSGRKQEASVMDRVKKGCTSFYASSQETLGYVKAFFVGWVSSFTLCWLKVIFYVLFNLVRL